jgi:hypothetical protein
MQVPNAEIEGRCAVGLQIIRDQPFRNDSVFSQKPSYASPLGQPRLYAALALGEPRPRTQPALVTPEFPDRPTCRAGQPISVFESSPILRS